MSIKLKRKTSRRSSARAARSGLAGAVEGFFDLGVDEFDHEFRRSSGTCPGRPGLLCGPRGQKLPPNRTASSTEKKMLSR